MGTLNSQSPTVQPHALHALQVDFLKRADAAARRGRAAAGESAGLGAAEAAPVVHDFGAKWKGAMEALNKCAMLPAMGRAGTCPTTQQRRASSSRAPDHGRLPPSGGGCMRFCSSGVALAAAATCGQWADALPQLPEAANACTADSPTTRAVARL